MTSKKAVLDGFFNDFTKHPPKWLCMLTACVDESYTKESGLYVVAGYLGEKEDWERYAEAWPKALGKRKPLHLKSMYLASTNAPRRYGALLKRLGSVPSECGLLAFSGSVCVHDYAHLVQGTALQILMEGYILAVLAFMDNIVRYVEPDDKVEVLFEQQAIHAEQRERAMIHWGSCHRRVDGGPTLSSWHTTEKSSLTESADYLCYALTQRAVDPTAQKAVLTAPILDAQPCIGNHQGKDMMVNWIEELKCGRLGPIPELTDRVKRIVKEPL